MVLNDARSFFLPAIDLLEPAVEGFGGAGEGEDDIDKLFILRAIDHGVSHDDLFRDVREFTEGGDFSGNLALAFLQMESLKEEHRDQSGEDDREVGEDLAEATNGHVGIGLPNAKGWSRSEQ